MRSRFADHGSVSDGSERAVQASTTDGGPVWELARELVCVRGGNSWLHAIHAYAACQVIGRLRDCRIRPGEQDGYGVQDDRDREGNDRISNPAGTDAEGVCPDQHRSGILLENPNGLDGARVTR